MATGSGDALVMPLRRGAEYDLIRTRRGMAPSAVAISDQTRCAEILLINGELARIYRARRTLERPTYLLQIGVFGEHWAVAHDWEMFRTSN